MKKVRFANDGHPTRVFQVDELRAPHRVGSIWFQEGQKRYHFLRRVAELDRLFKKMNSFELEETLSRYPGFLGVVPVNHLTKPVNLSRNCYFVLANTDPCFRRGQHWVAFFFYKLTSGIWRAEYFDSFGQPPKQKVMRDYIKSWCGENWVFNSTALQAKGSSVCGCYCIYFILTRMCGFNMKYIISCLLSNLDRDRIVYEFCKRIAGNKSHTVL